MITADKLDINGGTVKTYAYGNDMFGLPDGQRVPVLFVSRDLMCDIGPGIKLVDLCFLANHGIVVPFEGSYGVSAVDVKEVLFSVPLKSNVFEYGGDRYLFVPLGNSK